MVRICVEVGDDIRVYKAGGFEKVKSTVRDLIRSTERWQLYDNGPLVKKPKFLILKSAVIELALGSPFSRARGNHDGKESTFESWKTSIPAPTATVDNSDFPSWASSWQSLQKRCTQMRDIGV